MKFAEAERRQFTADMRRIVHVYTCRCAAIGKKRTEATQNSGHLAAAM